VHKLEWLDEIFQLLVSWQGLGLQVLPDGSRRIGRVAHVAPEAYLHCIPGPLSGEEIVALERTVGRSFLPVLKDFYFTANGLSVFSDNLGVYGYRRSYQRSNFASAAAQPYDLRIPNVSSRPAGLPVTDLVVGYYTEDGSYTVMDANGAIYRISRDSSRPLENRWSSLREWLTVEVRRLSGLFDEAGLCIHEDDLLPTPATR